MLDTYPPYLKQSWIHTVSTVSQSVGPGYTALFIVQYNVHTMGVDLDVGNVQLCT